MKKSVQVMCVLLSIILLATVFFGCATNTAAGTQAIPSYSSFREIPGVTAEEIAAIEALQKENDSFIYAMLASTELFYDENGDIKGFAALLCNELTDLFAIPFVPTIYEDIGEFYAGLEDGSIDFTSDLTATPERREKYFMTGHLAERQIAVARLAGSEPISEIAKSRTPRLAFLEGAVAIDFISPHLDYVFEPIFVSSREFVYDMLINEEIDAYFDEKQMELFFTAHKEIVVEGFLPMLFHSVSLATQNPRLEPIITVSQKALDSGAQLELIEFNNAGYAEYQKYKLSARLTDEEREYIRRGAPIRFLAEVSNYPVSFYNEHAGEWQGIAIDVMDEISMLTGLTYEIVNKPTDEWPALLEMLTTGQGSMISELLYYDEREGMFLWPSSSFMTGNYVMISEDEYPNISLNEIFLARVGLVKDTAHAEAFKTWFPSNTKAIEYENTDVVFDALIAGKIDLVMSTHHKLLMLTNFRELPGYKANVVFDHTYESTFGLNINETVLRGIIEKALDLTDTNLISGQWMRKTYDYRIKLAQTQQQWIIGAAVLTCILLIAVIFLLLNHIKGKRLEHLVTERTKELGTNASVLTAIFDSSPDIMFCMDLNLKYLRINKAMERHFNLTESEVIGKGDDEVMDTSVPKEVSDLMHEINRKVLNEKKAYMLEEFVPAYDGCDVWMETTKTPLWLNGEMIGILGMAHDVTLRKSIEDEARAASQSKSAFLANMSHELRTPLNVIIGLSDLVLEEELPEHVRANQQSIGNAGSTLLSIVNDILDISKIESGKMKFVPVEYHTPSLLNDTAILTNTYIDEKPIVFKLNIDDDLPGKLYGDEVRVKQIITNLLSNAIKYTHEGVVELTVNCERDDNNDIWMNIIVKDTGIGIRKEDLEKLFSDYYQTDMKTNRKTEGTGLGLSITRKMVEMMDGTITVKSEYGKGSTFHARIKQGFVSDTIIGSGVAETLRSFSFSETKRQTSSRLVRVDLSYAAVLVVDDMQNNLDVASGLMHKYNMKVDCLTSGQAAVDRIRCGAQVYQAIFMDHMMPEMDGIETVRMIRSLDTEYARNIPIIALTANAIAGTEKQFFENGFQDFLSKPIDIVQLDSVLKKWLRNKDKDAGKQARELPAATVSPIESSGIHIDISGLDTRKALIRYSDDTDMYIAILRSYAANTPAVLDTLRNPTEENIESCIINSHGLKGSSANICAEKVRAAAAGLEITARKGDLNKFRVLAKPLLEDAERLVAAINTWLASYDGQNEKPRIESPDREILSKLRKSCEDYDMSGIDDAMDALESKSYDNDGELIPWLRERVDIMELDEVIERLKTAYSV